MELDFENKVCFTLLSNIVVTSSDKRRNFSLIHFGDIGIRPVDKEWRSKKEKQDSLYLIVLIIRTHI